MGLFSKKNKEPKKDEVVKSATDKSLVSEKKEKISVKTKSKSVVDKKSSRKTNNASAYRFLLRPVISEKTTIAATDGKYTFEVAASTNKVAIKQAVLEIYGVMPIAVNIINQAGKNVRFGKSFGKTKDIKKAIVTLKKGDSIKLYEGI